MKKVTDIKNDSLVQTNFMKSKNFQTFQFKKTVLHAPSLIYSYYTTKSIRHVFKGSANTECNKKYKQNNYILYLLKSK